MTVEINDIELVSDLICLLITDRDGLDEKLCTEIQKNSDEIESIMENGKKAGPIQRIGLNKELKRLYSEISVYSRIREKLFN